MEEEKKRIYTIVAIVALVGILFSCIVGAVAGGVAGLLVGKRQARVAMERAVEEGLGILEEQYEEMPIPWQDEYPFQLPDPEDEIPMPPVVPFEIEGAFIRQVVEGTPADQAGLEPGDIIVGIDRTPIDGNHPLPEVITQYEPGDRITVRFWRADDEHTTRVRLAENPDVPGQAYLGVYFEMITIPELDLPGG